jgi:hypothetical protein
VGAGSNAGPHFLLGHAKGQLPSAHAGGGPASHRPSRKTFDEPNGNQTQAARSAGQVGGGNRVAGAAGAKEFEVRKIAALILASAAGAVAAAAPASSTSTLVSNSPWWEKITVTLSGDGKAEGCRYETSLKAAAEGCDVASQSAMVHKASDSKGEVTQITFERRFNPGAAPATPELKPGDTLLGGQVMALAIDPKGAVKNCRVVAASGAMRPDYSCDDASAERFQASVGGAKTAQREGYMTIIVYGHSEHMV